MAIIKFIKMNGLGNDFIILDHEEYEKCNISPDKLAIKLCNRYFGIGADGLIIVDKSEEGTDIAWIFYNSDGSIAEMCGNGIRCYARYVHDKKIVDKKEIAIETKAGIKIVTLVSDEEVRVNMGSPILEPSKIPVDSNTNVNTCLVDGKEFTVNSVSMGNPHAVIFVKEDSRKLAHEFGPKIETHKLFPNKTNVEFAEVVSRKEVNLDVWERGCGITLACGTGACATAVAGILNGYLDDSVKVNLPGGSLKIEWKGTKDSPNENVFMTGKADYSFMYEDK